MYEYKATRSVLNSAGFETAPVNYLFGDNYVKVYNLSESKTNNRTMGLKNIKTFESYITEAMSPKDNEIVKDYVEKFSMKMADSTRGTAAGWVDGIEGISDDVKRAIWAGIQEFISKDKDSTKLPAWINEAESTKLDVEMANVIYDTLMNNTQHEQFDVSKVDDETVDGNQIYFIYEGVAYVITVDRDMRSAG